MKILTRKRPKYKQSQTLRVKTQKCTLILISQNKDYMEEKKNGGGGGEVWDQTTQTPWFWQIKQ